MATSPTILSTLTCNNIWIRALRPGELMIYNHTTKLHSSLTVSPYEQYQAEGMVTWCHHQFHNICSNTDCCRHTSRSDNKNDNDMILFIKCKIGIPFQLVDIDTCAVYPLTTMTLPEKFVEPAINIIRYDDQHWLSIGSGHRAPQKPDPNRVWVAPLTIIHHINKDNSVATVGSSRKTTTNPMYQAEYRIGHRTYMIGHWKESVSCDYNFDIIGVIDE
jgi:hypothetical protein